MDLSEAIDVLAASVATADAVLPVGARTQWETGNVPGDATEFRAQVDVARGGRTIAHVDPGKNQYPVAPGGPTTSNEVSIYHDWRNLGDVFTIADRIDRDGSVYLKVLVKPLVNLIWLAGFVFVGGALVALWPDPAEQRRLAERYRPDAAVVKT